MMILWMTSAAFGCGGFFCTPAITPIDQAAEEIVFAYDAEQEQVEMHIEVTYAGASDDFAWVLPVPEEPELFLSSAALFSQLAILTAPTFTLEPETLGNCASPVRIGCAQDVNLAAVRESQDYTDVTVVGEAQIGPYDTVTLQAADSEALLTWLGDNDYDLPADIGPLLDVYIADRSYFVAMRLSTGMDTGDIEPIALRYAASGLAIPIQLTAIAASEDMPLRVYIFGDHRAVPESYLSAEINEAAIDWLGQGANYYDVIEAAANEADGHAFVTEMASKTEGMSEGTGEALGALLKDYPYLTRMTAVLSPEEMTVDPTFTFNSQLPDVAKDRVATLVRDCSGRKKAEKAPTWIELSDGRIVELGLDIDQGARNTERFVSDLQGVSAMSISDLTVGKGEVIADFAVDATATLEAHNRGFRQGGCGCASAPIPSSILVLAGLVFFLRRRRAS
jgi:uncharacterized protein (TIGR03382 family)